MGETKTRGMRTLLRVVAILLLFSVGWQQRALVLSDINLNRCLTGKLMHDIVGHYDQPAILNLHLEGHRRPPVRDSSKSKKCPGGGSDDLTWQSL
jgi:hypothetical protein